MRRQRVSSLAGICLLFSIRVASAEPEVGTGFVSSALATAYKLCQSAPIGGSVALLTAIAEDAGLNEADARQQLRALIDSLDSARARKTDLWQDITEIGQPQVESRKAARFLKHLIAESQTILRKEGADYSLDHKVAEASRKAKLTVLEGPALLARSWARATRASDRGRCRPVSVSTLWWNSHTSAGWPSRELGHHERTSRGPTASAPLWWNQSVASSASPRPSSHNSSDRTIPMKLPIAC